ncbi:MAG: galactokinase family protein [Clostridiaceae bacterium]|nr:galactokinase family protein [Clostridiaceae bacterium]MDY5889260.1 galactokinase family protein [Oscillospiraceae bacterium]
MADSKILKEKLASGDYDARLKEVYLSDKAVADQKERLAVIIDEYVKLFGDNENIELFSAPGRTEVGGNHTDHNHGKVLAASVDLDTVAAAAKRDDSVIVEKSFNFDALEVDISDLNIHTEEFGKSSGLIRGMCAGFVEYGYKIGGFNAASMSRVLSGSGLSSSAAYEVLIGTILNHLYNDGKVSAVDIAKIAQFAENKYFGKPCGLMDQMASSVGSFITIDFKDPSEPIIKKVNFDFASCGHALCIIDTGGDHADLTDDYAAVRGEMEQAAEVFGKNVLRDVDETEFMRNISLVREKVNDRAVLRAMHFYAENKRAEAEVKALESGDFDAFKELVTESGRSSYMYNQNVFTTKDVAHQGVSLALAMCEYLLKGKGAWRVHGGGFAGTIQAFVPVDMLDDFCEKIEAVFSKGSCHVLSIRPFGGIKLL